jgi:UDP-N-acetylbacillosamine N-acetyltransferase
MKRNAIVIGYSGHAYVVIDTLLSNNYLVIGYCENQEKTNNPYLLKYFGPERNLGVLDNLKSADVFIGIGKNSIRAGVFDYLVENKISCPFVIHKSAYVSSLCDLGSGSVIMPGAVVNTQTKIGNAVICNSSSVIEHGSQISDYVHIGPGAVLAGDVSIGSFTFVGANAFVREGIKVGAHVTIGAGSVITKDVADGVTIFGNPARISNG